MAGLRGSPPGFNVGRGRCAVAIFFGCILLGAAVLVGSVSGPRAEVMSGFTKSIADPLISPGVSATVAPQRGMAIAAATCAGTGGAYDFNGDRHRDIAIADPGANDGAGRIIVQYEGINVTQTIDQNAASNNLWGAEAGDQFGYSMDVVDWNSDGCTDLLVGVPYEDLANGGRDHGMVHLIYGSPDGLGKGKASENWSQDSDAAGFGDAAENRDHFGYAVAASRTAANQPYLLIGVPGEDHFGHWDAGLVHVLRGTANYAMWSGNGIPGAAALNDQVGYSLDAATHHFVLGRPGDTIGDRPFAGSAQVSAARP